MSVEKKIKAASGWGMLAACLVAFVIIIALFIGGICLAVATEDSGESVTLPVLMVIVSITLFIGWCILVSGFFTLQPGQARVCILFGDYKGTVRDEGFRWANPFYSRSMGSNSAAENATAEVISKSGLSLGKPDRDRFQGLVRPLHPRSPSAPVRLNGEILEGPTTRWATPSRSPRRGVARGRYREGPLRRRQLRAVRGHAG